MLDKLTARAAQLGILMTREQAEKFEAYHGMLTEANRHFNLTRVPDSVEEAIDRNYLDCAAPLQAGLPENVKTMVDVGSGAGFPGIPLAILRPDIHITLMDSLDKRVGFLREVCTALQLNAEAVHLRAEDGARKPEYREAFDLATARAVAALNLLSEYLLPFVKVGGWMMAYKGPSADQELREAENALALLGGKWVRTENVAMPGRDWDHRILYFQKQSPTPEKYPRKAGKPEKKPL